MADREVSVTVLLARAWRKVRALWWFNRRSPMIFDFCGRETTVRVRFSRKESAGAYNLLILKKNSLIIVVKDSNIAVVLSTASMKMSRCRHSIMKKIPKISPNMTQTTLHFLRILLIAFQLNNVSCIVSVWSNNPFLVYHSNTFRLWKPCFTIYNRWRMFSRLFHQQTIVFNSLFFLVKYENQLFIFQAQIWT